MAWIRVLVLLLFLQDWLITAVEYKLTGDAYFVYTFPKKYQSSSDTQTIHMLFRTTQPFGVLLHARGTNGDFVTLEIVRGKLRYASVYDRGNPNHPGYQDVIVGDDLGDDQWHQIDVERYGNHVIIKLDITKEYVAPRELRNPLKINQDLYIARTPPPSPSNESLLPPMSLTGKTFRGCMEDVTYNDVNIFEAAKKKSKYVYVSGRIEQRCPEDTDYFPATTLTKPTSFITLNSNGEKLSQLNFKFRTFDQSGVLVHQNFPRFGSLLVELVFGKLWLTYSSDSFVTQVKISSKILSLQDGLWQRISLNFTQKDIMVQINNKTTQKISNIFQKFNPVLENSVVTIGSKFHGKHSLISCVKNIYFNRKNVDVESSAPTKDVEIEKCYLIDRCYTNPCLHNGHCLQQNNTQRCDCSRTGHHGKRCEVREKTPPPATTRKPGSHLTPRATPTVSTLLKSTPLKSGTTGQSMVNLRSSASKELKGSSTDHPDFYSTTALGVETTKLKSTPILPSSSRELVSTNSQNIVSRTKLPKLKATLNSTTTNLRSSTTYFSGFKTPLPGTTRATTTTKHEESSVFNLSTTNLPFPMAVSHNTVSSSGYRKESSPISSPVQQLKAASTRALPNILSTRASNSTPHPSSSTHVLNQTIAPTKKVDRRIIIIEKTDEFPDVTFNKDQILLYFFMSITFVVFVGLVVIISVKVSRLKMCAWLAKCGIPNTESIQYQDSLELHEPNGSNESLSGTKIKVSRPSSLNDSGIDQSDSGTASNRTSAELSITEEYCPVDESENPSDDSMKGFLVLQEEPSVYTQETFGWELLDGTIPRLSRISASNFVENELRIVSAEDAVNLNESVATADNETGSEILPGTAYRQAKYRKLHDEDTSSIDGVCIDIRS